jgi:hypothetical protein
MRALIIAFSLFSTIALSADRDALLDGCSSITDAERRAQCFEALARMPAQAAPATNQNRDAARARCEYEAEMAIANISNPVAAGVRKGELLQLCARSWQAAQPMVVATGPATAPTDFWVGSGAEKVYYHPSCGDAGKLSRADRKIFVSERAAESAGYRRSTAPGC